MKCIIMAGGRGSRLWPLSTAAKPKQFQAVTCEKTMLQHTYERVRKIFDVNDIYVSTNLNHIDEVACELPEVNIKHIVGEPVSRGTASAIALITEMIYREDNNALIAMFASDHVIRNEKNFLQGVVDAEKYVSANTDSILCFGVVPTIPATAYGYIKRAKKPINDEFFNVYHVERFVEKPDLKTAKTYLESGDYLWNVAMYVYDASYMMSRFKEFALDTFNTIKTIVDSIDSENYIDVLKTEYAKMDDIQVEYSIIEKEKNVVVIPVDLEWSDVGSWAALKDTFVDDRRKHFVKGDHMDFRSENLLVYGGKKMIVTMGLKDLIIVDTDDAILICDRSESQNVSQVVNKLDELKKSSKKI